MLAEEFLRVYDMSDEDAANPRAVWQALLELVREIAERAQTATQEQTG
jgi:hypothetical protein